MMPSSRKACLKSSPALVVYAEALLVIQYIYGLSLTDNELPQEVVGVNLKQIGFVKYPHLPVLPLTVKVQSFKYLCPCHTYGLLLFGNLHHDGCVRTGFVHRHVLDHSETVHEGKV